MKRLAKEVALARVAAERTASCPMCALVEHGPSIASSEHAVAVLDRYAARPGHVLVIPRRHEEQLSRLPWPEYEQVQRLAWETSRALDAVLAPRRIYVAALGSAVPLATSFPHLHVHVIPLFDGGEADRPANVLTWEHGMYVFDDAAEEAALRDQLRAALAQ